MNFRNLDSILNIYKNNIPLIGDIFLNLRTPKNVVRYMSKNPVSEDPFTSNMVNALKHCWNLIQSTFAWFIHHSEGNFVRKSVS